MQLVERIYVYIPSRSSSSTVTYIYIYISIYEYDTVTYILKPGKYANWLTERKQAWSHGPVVPGTVQYHIPKYYKSL